MPKRSRGRMSEPPMPVEALRELLRYDAESGLLYWRVIKRGRRPVAGGVSHTRGYVSVMIDGSRWQAHGLIWFLVTGDWLMIDHEDADTGNNRWSNLRPATKQENGWNSRAYAKSGFKGVYPTPSGKWTARLKIGDQLTNFPSRDTPEEAFADYCAAAREHHGAFARLS